MKQIGKKPSSNKGFTLIELSIVLVIIGLIVGGVLVGQDLIKAAELRATMSQIEKYETAANTFRLKYNGLPGDLASATTFFSGVTADGDNGEGDGDGLVEDISASGTLCTAETCIAGEVIIFWYELAQAGLIGENMTSASAAAFTLTPADNVIPPSKGGSGRVHISARGGTNYWVLGNPGTAAAVTGNVTWAAAWTPTEAYQMDSKMDDGNPETGIFISIDQDVPVPGTAAGGAATGSFAATHCYDSTADVYGLTTINSNDNSASVVCNMSIRASF